MSKEQKPQRPNTPKPSRPRPDTSKPTPLREDKGIGRPPSKPKK